MGAVTAVGLVGLVLCLGSLAAAGGTRPARALQQQRCFAANVLGRTVQQARAVLRARGCLPGYAKDGRHFLITKACRPIQDFGRVFAQSATNRRLGPKERLIVSVGIRQTADGMICGEVNPGPGQAPTPADYDGTYRFTFTVTESSVPLAKPGQQMTGLRFNAANGILAGDIAGNVDANGRGANIVVSLIGFQCPGDLTFGVQGATITVEGSANCGGGAVKGKLAGEKV